MWCMWGEGGGACGRREVVHVGGGREVVHVGGGRWCMWGEGGGACGGREVVHVGKREVVSGSAHFLI